ncbi:sterol desaturase family protein [uncultured Tateyamaria sp.]|uniref:sterol desaturase family protein n=1 Tax=uncultured Tateyamaria sp. TaxID=455651 RepID=UPI002617EFAD|nr:sterol desaturase family protein [uncultured Tateyamaria sp.]
MDAFYELLDGFTGFLFDWNSRLALLYLCLTVALVYVIWRVRGRPTSFTAFLLPRDVYTHKSNLVDIQIFLFNKLLTVSGFFAAVTLTPVVTSGLLTMMLDATGGDLAPAVGEGEWGKLALATLIMILTLDFCKYWAHRLHHENALLWPFHALHHSAEVLTPLTANRNHPVFVVIRLLIYALIIGAVQALMLFLLMGKIDVLTIGSVNAGYFLFNAFGANLRHSHVWLSYGRVMEHILISPAQHQVHHSNDPKHYNKNYGEVFAFWDLMFGSLYVPKEHEILSFGLSDENGVPIEQPHPTLRAALLHPFAEAWQTLTKGTTDDPASPQNRETAQ